MAKRLTPDSVKNNSEKRAKPLTRPLMTFGYTFFLAMIVASFIPFLSFENVGDTTIFATIILLCFFMFLALLLNRKTRNNRHVMTVAFAVVTAFSLYFLKEMMIAKPIQKFDGETRNLTIQVLDEVGYRDDSAFVTAKILESEDPSDELLIGKKATLWFYGNEFQAKLYDKISGEFTLTIPSDSEEGEVRGYSKSRDIYLNLSSGVYGDTGLAVTKRESINLGYLIVTLKNKLVSNVISVSGNEDVSGLMIGIAIGDKENINSETARDFRIIGASHILAVSGFHTSLIAMGLFGMLTFLKVRKRPSALVSIGGVLFFMALTGFSQSVMRSGFMSIIFMLGIMIDREADGQNSLGFSVLIICLINPYAVHDVGLLLSFGATYGIIVIYSYLKSKISDKIRKREDKLRYFASVVDSVLLTLSATLPLVPILALCFGTLSLISPITNLLLIFPSSVVMVLTLIGGAIMLIPPVATFGEIILRISGYVARFMCLVAEWLSKIPYAEVSVKNSFVLFLLVVLLPFMLLCFKFFGKKGVRNGTIVLVAVLVFGGAVRFIAMKDTTSITMLPVGNGTGILVSDGNYNGVILVGEKTVVPKVLRKLNETAIKRLDFIAVDSNSDICSNVGMITEKFDVGEIITCAGGEYSDVLALFESENSVVEISSGSQYFYDDDNLKLSFYGKEGDTNKIVEFSVGETRFTVFPTDSTIDETSDFDNSIGIFTVSPPKGYKSLNLTLGMVNCSKDKFSYVEKAFKETKYPVFYTYKGASNIGRIFGDGINILTDGKGTEKISVS